MKIAVAVTSDFSKVAGHAGQARRWLLFAAGPEQAPVELARIELPKELVFHHWSGEGAHPLDGIAAVIAQSAGEGFLNRLRKRGVDPVMTAEADPLKAVADYLGHSLAPPKPRPIGSLICKLHDLFSPHK